MIVVVWGVSGCGKSTIGKKLAGNLGCDFFDADDFHPESNIAKMRDGVPLNDEYRWPWLDTIAATLRESLADGRSAVLACSALREIYRERLNIDRDNVKFVQLRGGFDLIAGRLATREHEFMNANLLESQFDTLEVRDDDLYVEIESDPDSICRGIEEILERA